MEVEQGAQVVAKKLWNVVRIVFYMLKTGVSKSKFMFDLNLMFKKSNKAITNLFLLLHHHHHHHRSQSLYSSFTCRSNTDVISSALIREYEFSCSNSPAYPFATFKRKRHHHHRHDGARRLPKTASFWEYDSKFNDDVTTVAAVQRVLEMLGNGNDHQAAVAAASSSPLLTFPGQVRQLRVTDSPFPLKDDKEGGDHMVDKAAEEFIKRFYKNLRLQKKMAAALESPCR